MKKRRYWRDASRAAAEAMWDSAMRLRAEAGACEDLVVRLALERAMWVMVDRAFELERSATRGVRGEELDRTSDTSGTGGA